MATSAPIERAALVFDSITDLVGKVRARIDTLRVDVERDTKAVAASAQALYATASSSFGNLQDTAASTPRVARILSTAVGQLTRYRIAKARQRHGPSDLADAALERFHRDCAEALYRLCVELRGGVLKVGQFISCRADLLPRAYVESLSRLQDQVPALPAEDIVARIEEELGKPVDELFAHFEEEPVAAASLAQVHRAVLHNGQTVAVKVQVPGADELIDIDVRALEVVAELLHNELPGVDLTTVTEQIGQSLHRELDYEAEAQATAEFGEAFAGDDRMVVPTVVPELSTRRVLTMEFIEGQRLREFLDGCADRGQDGPRDRDRVFEILLDTICHQIFTTGALHADPHPGNFLVLPGPRIALLDFGCIQRFEPDVRRAYAEVLQAFLLRDRERVAELLGIIGFDTHDGDPSALVELADLFMEALTKGASVADIDPQEQMARALAVIGDNPIAEVPQSFVLLGRVFAAISGLIMHYRPGLPLFPIVSAHVAKALASVKP